MRMKHLYELFCSNALERCLFDKLVGEGGSTCVYNCNERAGRFSPTGCMRLTGWRMSLMEKCNGFIIDVISVLKFHIGLTLDADFPGPQSCVSACNRTALSHDLEFIKDRSSAQNPFDSDAISW